MEQYINTKTNEYPVYKIHIITRKKGFDDYELVYNSTKPDYNKHIQYIKEVKPIKENNRYIKQYEIVDKTQSQIEEYISERKLSIKQTINDIRYSKLYSDSIDYIFPGDTEPDGIQMRDETDRQNIQDFVIDASNKDPDTIMHWMPVSNSLKTMKASEAVDMGQVLKSRGDDIIGYSWLLKSKVDSAIDNDDLDDIDINSGWPL